MKKVNKHKFPSIREIPKKFIDHFIKNIQSYSPILRVILSSIPIVIYLFVDFFSVEGSIQETALMVSHGTKLHYSNKGIHQTFTNPDFYIIRSKGAAELSIILSGELLFNYFKEKSPLYFAHDIVVCKTTCNFSQINNLIPPILAEISFNESKSFSSLFYSSETPLDLILATIQAFQTNFKNEQRIGSKGHPYLHVSLPSKKIGSIDALLDALNRMENKLIHGQMYFLRKNNKTIPITPLFIASFAILIPMIFESFSNFSIPTALSSLLPLLFTLLYSNHFQFIANIIMLLHSAINPNWESSCLGPAFKILCLLPCAPDFALKEAFLTSIFYILSYFISIWPVKHKLMHLFTKNGQNSK